MSITKDIWSSLLGSKIRRRKQRTNKKAAAACFSYRPVCARRRVVSAFPDSASTTIPSTGRGLSQSKHR